MSDASLDAEQAGADRYLVYWIGAEAFASPLLSVREIVEPLPYRPVPVAHAHFLGLGNLRGQLVGLLDLGVRFGLEPVADAAAAVLLVFDFDGTSMAGLVHRVEAVKVIAPADIVREHRVESRVPAEAFLGVARLGRRLIPIVSLPELVACDVHALSERPAA